MIKGIDILETVNVNIGKKPVEIGVAKVPIDKIKMNKFNPNLMDEKTMENLGKNIDTTGFLEFPVLYYDKLDKALVCIDGEHRVLAVKNKGGKFVFANIVLKGLTQSQAFSGAYTFNQFKGKIDEGKLAKMLQYGLSNYTERDVLRDFVMKKYKLDETLLSSQKNISEHEVEHHQATREIQKLSDEAIQHAQKELDSVPIDEVEQILMVNLTSNQHKVVMDVLKGVAKREYGRESEIGKALFLICKKYRKIQEAKKVK